MNTTLKNFASISLSLVVLFGHAIAAEKKMGGISLDRSSMTQMALPQFGDIPFLISDFEYPKNEKPRVYLMDFNRDGIDDYFVESMGAAIENPNERSP